MKKIVWLITALLFFTVSLPVMAKEVLIPVTKLGLAPWLGEIKDEKDLAKKFAKEKAYFAGYIQYDLKEVAKLEITSSEASQIVSSLELSIKETKEISVPDETVFKSMGWKSKKGNVMRTKNPILKLGKPTKGFPVKVEFKDYEIEYVFLKDCGNLCLRNVGSEVPPKAEYVPSPKEEAPPPKIETPRPRYAEPLPSPPPPEYREYRYYVEVMPPPYYYEWPAIVPWILPPPPFIFYGGSYGYRHDRYHHYGGYRHHRPSPPRHYSPPRRAPRVRTR